MTSPISEGWRLDWSHGSAELWSQGGLLGPVTLRLRDGRSVMSAPAHETDAASVIRHMVGRTLTELYPTRPLTQASTEAPLLQVQSLTLAADKKSPLRLRDISFQLHAGEVLGIFGLMGAGRSDGVGVERG